MKRYQSKFLHLVAAADFMGPFLHVWFAARVTQHSISISQTPKSLRPKSCLQSCTRINSYYWQCLPSSQIPTSTSADITIIGSTAQNVSYPHVGPNPDITLVIAAPQVLLREPDLPSEVASTRHHNTAQNVL